MRTKKRSPRFSALPVFLLSATAASYAQTAAMPQNGRVLPARAADHAADQLVSDAPATQMFSLSVSLPVRDLAALQQLIQDQGNPKSPRYRQYLTPAQFAQQFGPTQADYDKVANYFRSHGFTVDKTFRARTVLRVSGPASAVNSTLHTTMRMYRHAADKRTYHAPAVEPTIDPSLPILNIQGLNNRVLPHSMLSRATANSTPTGSGPNGSFLGSDMRAAYAPGIAAAGEGQTLGLLELGAYNVSDVNNYFSSIGQPLNVPIVNVLEGVDGSCTNVGQTGGCDDGEEVIDMEQALSMAPNLAALIIYETYGSVNPLEIFAQAADDDVARQLSFSFGIGGTPAQVPDFEQVLMQLEVQGQSLFVATGDSGANLGGVDYPANSTHVITVGGTDLVTNGAAGTWAAETAWVGSTGGWNSQSPIASWQLPFINSANRGSTQYRNVPDVAAEANGDNYLCIDGTCGGTIGGTSLAAPRWAGFMALVNEQANGHSIQTLNQTFYQIGQSSSYDAVFHDIVQGSNANSSSGGLFSATTGYDLTTGWGSPNGQAMIDLLAPPSEVSSGPNFTLSVGPSSVSIEPGGSTTVGVTLAPVNGFSGPVSLNVVPVGAPAGVTASLDASTLTTSGSANLTVQTTAATTTTGTLLIAVTGTASGITQTAYLRLGMGDFSISSSSPVVYVNQSSSATDNFSLSGTGGFDAGIGLVMGNAPDGTTTTISSTSNSLTVQASNIAAPTPAMPVIMIGNSGSITHDFTLFNLAVSAATGTCGLGTPVSLASHFNLTGLSSDGSYLGGKGLDGEGYTLSSTALTSSRVLDSIRFNFGTANLFNAMYGTGQTVTLPAGSYQALQLLGTGLNGNQTAQPITVTYTDGTTTHFLQNFSDWFVPTLNANEMEAVASQYRNTVYGGKASGQFNVYAYQLPLNASKTVKSFTMPSNRNVVVLAASLTPVPLGTPVTLPFNVTGIYPDGATFAASGGLDAGGHAYSGTLLNDSSSGEQVLFGGLGYRLGGAGVPDALYGTGTPISLPAGSYSQLTMLGAAVDGDQISQPVVITYTDGTTSTYQQNFSDWSNLSGYTGESLVMQNAYRDAANGTTTNQLYNIYRYAYPLNTGKQVSSVTLPNDPDVLVLAMTLDNNAATYTQEAGSCNAPQAAR